MEEALETGQTPEEVCGGSPELLGEVRERWERVRALEDQVESLFPTPNPRATGRRSIGELDQERLPDIPGYAVESMVGSGGMGVVYKARHLGLGRPVAIKMLLTGPLATPHELEALLREARAVAGLGGRHANIVQVHDVGEVDGRAYFTMEYVEGGTLARRLAGTPQPARDAAAMVATIADAVQSAHAGGVVHRDLKPSNILLTADGTPRIADFSLARRIDGGPQVTLTGAAMGTPSYMAPEQVLGRSDAFASSVDIYALGALLYEMLTGRPPFRAESSAETQRQVLSEEPAAPSRLNAKVPRDLETICLKCLQKAPGRRYPTAGALADDLRRFLDGRPVEARRPGAAERAARWARRNPSHAALVGVAGLLVALALAAGAREWRLAAARRADIERTAERLGFVAALQQAERFTEARGVLDNLADGGSPVLRRSIERARADLDIARRLSAIRLGRDEVSPGGVINYEESSRAYEAAFREAGLGATSEESSVVAARLNTSPIRTALLAALDDWAACATAGRRAWILAVARAMDPDPWRDRVRDQFRWADIPGLEELARTAVIEEQPVTLLVAMGTRWRRLGGDPTAFLERVQRRYPDDFWVNFELCHLLGGSDAEAAIGYGRAALAIRPDASIVHYKMGLYLWGIGRHDEAGYHYARTVELEPGHAWGHVGLAAALVGQERLPEALEHYRAATALEPADFGVLRGVLFVLAKQGRHEEARTEWRRWLDTGPAAPEDWDGYAELCLFLGDEAEYRRTRDELLARFGEATDPHVCERIGRACVLLPASAQQFRAAGAMIDRALAAEPPEAGEWARPYFRFARALADYREERLESAASLLESVPSDVLPPAPKLLLAMIQGRRGERDQARSTLASAVADFDWRTETAVTREAWMYHVLRREAEGALDGATAPSRADRP